MHPVLKSLELDNDRALAILNLLLERHYVKESKVKTAFNALYSSSPQKPIAAKNAAVTPATAAATPATTITAPSHRYRHMLLEFYYDGSHYSGLAENIGSDTDNSVEKHLFAALRKTCLVQGNGREGYSRCGRTDKGVSAAGQVVAALLKSRIPLDATWDEAGTQPVETQDLPKNAHSAISVWVPEKRKKQQRKIGKSDKDSDMKEIESSTPPPLPPRVQKQLSEYAYDQILNKILPPSIQILGCCPVSVEFSARFSATQRTYRYFFIPASHWKLDKLKEGLSLLEGSHDFRNFCKMDVEKVYNFERKIYSATLHHGHEEGNKKIYYIQIIGQAFLWHQIRCIVTILFYIGQGHEEPSIVTDLFDVTTKYSGKPSYTLAPEQPLVLHHCSYQNVRIGYNVRNLWTLTCTLQQEWQDLQLAAARIQNCLTTLQQERQINKQDLIQFCESQLQERTKKWSKRHGTLRGSSALLPLNVNYDTIPKGANDEDVIPWRDAQEWLALHAIHSIKETIHLPLEQRDRGTTLEEKIQAVQQSKRRKLHYDADVVHTAETKEQDQKFYQHMMNQGGSAIS